MLDMRSFVVSMQLAEVTYRTKLDMKRMHDMVAFDARLCFNDEGESKALYESSSEKIEKAIELFSEGCSEFFAATSLKSENDDQKEILNKYIRSFKCV